MNSYAQSALSVRLVLQDMEAALGLDGLPEGEVNLLAALVLCGGLTDMVAPAELRRHALISGLTHPTYHRMLRNLIERGLVELVTGPSGRRGYTVLVDASMSTHRPEVQAAS